MFEAGRVEEESGCMEEAGFKCGGNGQDEKHGDGRWA